VKHRRPADIMKLPCFVSVFHHVSPDRVKGLWFSWIWIDGDTRGMVALGRRSGIAAVSTPAYELMLHLCVITLVSCHCSRCEVCKGQSRGSSRGRTVRGYMIHKPGRWWCDTGSVGTPSGEAVTASPAYYCESLE